MTWYNNGIVTLIAVLSICTIGQAEEPATDKKWKLQAGWAHQWGRKMDVRGSAPSWYGSLIPLGDASVEDIPDGWNYIDGYVLPDEQSDVPPGGNPNNPLSTHNWHYENSEQYSGGDNPTLTFQRGLGLQYIGESFGLTRSDAYLSDEGIEIKLSRWLHTWTNVNVDLELLVGVAFFPDTHPMKHTHSTSQQMAEGVETHVYLDYYWEPGLPSLDTEYYGEFYSISGDNPLIPLEPWRIETEAQEAGIVQDLVKVEGNLWHLRGELGVTLRKPLTSRLSAYLSPQFALEFVDVSVKRTETVTFNNSRVAKRTHRKSKMALIPGFLLTVGADYMITENWFLGGSVGWEWLAEDVDVKVGPDTAVFDLEGGDCNLYFGRKF